MAAIFVRTFILYILLTFIFRMMGKRQVGELEMSDLITTLLLSEIAALPIDNPDIPLLFAVVPIVIITCFEVIVTFATTRWNGLKKFFEGKPVILVSKGKIDEQALAEMRITLDELLSECRQAGISHISDVNYIILEPNGKMSILPNSANSAVTPSDLGVKAEDRGIMHPLIIDGKPVPKNPQLVGIDEAQVEDICHRRHLEIGDVFLLGMDDAGHITCIKKERKDK